MFGWVQPVVDFVRSWPGAFALFGAAFTALALKVLGYVGSEVELTISFIGSIGFWMIVAKVVDAAARWAWSVHLARIERGKAEIRAKAAAEEEAARAEIARFEEGERRKRVIANISQLHPWEEAALFYFFHSTGQRARASINHSGIKGLSDFGLLVPEDTDKWPTDRIWVIPTFVVAELEAAIGKPDVNKRAKRPPWEGKNHW